MEATLLLLNRPEIRRIEGMAEYVAHERAELGRLSRAEWNTLIAFGVTVSLWILPGVVAVLGASLLFRSRSPESEAEHGARHLVVDAGCETRSL